MGAASIGSGIMSAKKELDKDYRSCQIEKITRIKSYIKGLIDLRNSGDLSDEEIEYIDDEINLCTVILKHEEDILKYIEANPKKYRAKNVFSSMMKGLFSGFLVSAGTFAVADKLFGGRLVRYITK